jgi:glutathione S-transferase
MKWGKVPVFEVNGEQMGESVAIGRYLARKYQLVGETPMEEFRADELIDAFADLLPHIDPILEQQDDGKKAELTKSFVQNHVEPFLAKVNVLKEKNGGKWLVGKNVSLNSVLVQSQYN